jgi:hypothetical protein
MLVTKEHDVFAQLGNASVEKNGSLMPDGSAAAHAKIQAGDLLEPTKTYNAVRQLAVAEAGVQKETVPDVCDELGLRTPQQRAVFYEIYGFWLGDGTLKYHGPNAGYVVQFAQVKEADNDWLAASLSELDVQYTKSAASKVGQVQITIQSDAWNRCFAAEYKHAADFVNEGDIDDIDADGVVDDDVDVSPTQSSKRKRADVSSEGADAVDALSNLKKFATFCEATDRHTATALHLQRVRDAVELTNDAIVAPPARAAALAPVDAEGRAFDTVSTANGSYMQPEGIKSAKWFASWVWRLGAASLRHVLAGLRRADGNVDQRTIYTSSARFRDEIQRVCLMAGYSAFFRCVSKGVDQGRTVTRDSWAVDVAESDGSPASDKASNPSLFKARGEIRERQYTGRVWCFTMPSGFIWVRRVAKDEHGVVTKASRPLISGNCQSMNIVTAMLLTTQDEETAFFTLRTMVEQMVPEYYRPSMIGSNVDQRVFAELLGNAFPKIAKHMTDIGLPVMIVSLPWFLCCYIGFVPMEVAMRILDCFFLEGPKVLFQIGLAMFAVHQKRVCATKDPVEVREILRERIDPNELLKIAFEDFGGLQNERIRTMRARHKFQTIRDLQEKNKKTQFRDSAAHHRLHAARARGVLQRVRLGAGLGLGGVADAGALRAAVCAVLAVVDASRRRRADRPRAALARPAPPRLHFVARVHHADVAAHQAGQESRRPAQVRVSPARGRRRLSRPPPPGRRRRARLHHCRARRSRARQAVARRTARRRRESPEIGADRQSRHARAVSVDSRRSPSLFAVARFVH